MQKKSTKHACALLLLLFAAGGAWSQGWERAFGAAKNDGFSDVVPTPDGGYLAVGHFQIDSLHRDVFLVKTDADGTEEWNRLIGDTLHQEYGKSIQSTTDGGYIIGGTALADNVPFGFLAKTDGFGMLAWLTLSSNDSIQGRRAIELADGGFALVGNEILPPTPSMPDGQNSDLMLMKVDADGVEQWIENFGGDGYDDGYGLLETPAGFLLAGSTNSFGAGHYDVFIVGADAAGNETWAETWGTANAELGHSLTHCADGNFAITGQREEATPESEDVFLLKIDGTGQPIWSVFYPKPGLETACSVQETADGGFIIAGNVKADMTADRQVFLLKTLADGTEYWTKTFGGNMGDGANAVKEAPNDGYIIAGFTHSFGSGGADGYLIRTDFSGISNSCFIAGNARTNLNNSCDPDNFGGQVPGYIVEVAGAITYFGTTDEFGNYIVPVSPGNYNVRLINPSPYWSLCEDSIEVALAGSFDTATVNFTLHTEAACALMEVDLTTLGLRRCFPGAYSVGYRNLGTVVANPGLVEVTFDEYLEIDSASAPWISQNGNTFLFEVGNIWPFEAGAFEVYFTVDCDSTVLGQTHCSEAHITPDTFCIAPDPIWDGSTVEVNAQCGGDSISFLIKNRGYGDMDSVLAFVIIEDDLVQMEGNFELESLQDTIITLPATGTTYRIEAEQSPGHPGNSQPSITVEGCGGSPFSTGFVIQYPLNDGDLSVDTDCRENTGSFDPNDKQGFPMGYGDQHFIDGSTEIEYLVRFQNTGTDTAFTVTIRDTISPFLDPTSIRPGAGSHPFEFELYGNGVLKFTFPDIMLPDSNVNEPASHGYVKFRIAQRPGNNPGTVIKNNAGIYFDFNEPVITNTTFHTVGRNFVIVDTTGTASPTNDISAQPKVHVYPNPFSEKALFELENVQANSFTFSLLDATGREVRQEGFEGDSFIFHRATLPAGFYLFRISSKGSDIATGKVILR